MNKTNQTEQQQLARRIIKDLRKWVSIGSIENWIEFGSHEYIIKRKLPKEYQPNLYLKYRLDIGTKLWMDSIIVHLKKNGKTGLADDIEERQRKFISEVSTIDKNLEPTSPMNLPTRQLNFRASRLANALEIALPCLAAQLIQIREKDFNSGKTFTLLKKIINDKNRKGVTCEYRTRRSLAENLRNPQHKDKYSEVANSLKFKNGKVMTMIPPANIEIIYKERQK